MTLLEEIQASISALSGRLGRLEIQVARVHQLEIQAQGGFIPHVQDLGRKRLELFPQNNRRRHDAAQAARLKAQYYRRRGWQVKTIAKALGCSERAVRRYLSRP